MESDQIQKITLERFPSSGELPFVCLSIKAASALLNVLLWWIWWNIVAIYAQTPSSVLTHAAPALKEIFHWLPSRHHRNDHHPKLCVT